MVCYIFSMSCATLVVVWNCMLGQHSVTFGEYTCYLIGGIDLMNLDEFDQTVSISMSDLWRLCYHQ